MQEARLDALIEKKLLKFAELQRKVRKEVCTEAWLGKESKGDSLLEWGRCRRAMPDSLSSLDLPGYRFGPPRPLLQQCKPEFLSLEIDRYWQEDA